MRFFSRLDFSRVLRLDTREGVAATSCFLCGDPMTSDHATVVVPHLALTVHLNCYERDIAAGKVA